jgi:hypothetical protein
MDGVSYPRRRTRASDRIVRPMASASDRRESVQLDGRPLSIEDVVDVARGGRPVTLAPAARTAMDAARAALERRAAGGEALYGINTGFGSLSRVRIPAGDLAALQVNLVRSHAAGVGDPLDREVVRAMMLVLAASLARCWQPTWSQWSQAAARSVPAVTWPPWRTWRSS